MATPEVITVRPPRIEDLDALHPIFEYWIRDRYTGEIAPDEIAQTEASIVASINGETSQEFMVAERQGKILGIMGIQAPHGRMLDYAKTQKPMELITALVSDDARRTGAGKELVRALIKKATERGAEEIIVNSGPRYEKTGWPFWQHLFGEPIGTAVGFYGPGGDAKVWRKLLKK